MSNHLDVTVLILIATLLLCWTWLAERWQRHRGRRFPTHTHTDRALNRSLIKEAPNPVRNRILHHRRHHPAPRA